jgi:hypothetical protein
LRLRWVVSLLALERRLQAGLSCLVEAVLWSRRFLGRRAIVLLSLLADEWLSVQVLSSLDGLIGFSIRNGLLLVCFLANLVEERMCESSCSCHSLRWLVLQQLHDQVDSFLRSVLTEKFSDVLGWTQRE